MSQSYHLRINYEKKGPYTMTQLKAMCASGEVDAETLYWSGARMEWVPITDLGEVLFEGKPHRFQSES